MSKTTTQLIQPKEKFFYVKKKFLILTQTSLLPLQFSKRIYFLYLSKKPNVPNDKMSNTYLEKKLSKQNFFYTCPNNQFLSMKKIDYIYLKKLATLDVFYAVKILINYSEAVFLILQYFSILSHNLRFIFSENFILVVPILSLFLFFANTLMSFERLLYSFFVILVIFN